MMKMILYGAHSNVAMGTEYRTVVRLCHSIAAGVGEGGHTGLLDQLLVVRIVGSPVATSLVVVVTLLAVRAVAERL